MSTNSKTRRGERDKTRHGEREDIEKDDIERDSRWRDADREKGQGRREER